MSDVSKTVSNRKGLLLFFGCLLIFSFSAEAQCAMCRAVLESEGNKSTAEGINNGIVYLMAIPYVLVGVLFYFVYRKIKG
jgi:TRAP-type C4-dicarboxylate transport system permease small subunit